MRIAVIGAGWVGSHIASIMKREGYQISVFEARSNILLGASAVNQCRLHQGFHYPRSHVTAADLLRAYPKFMEIYGPYTTQIEDNIYAISSYESLIDLPSYCSLMSSHGAEFQKVSAKSYNLSNVEGAIICQERAINLPKARARLRDELRDSLRLSTPVKKVDDQPLYVTVNGERFDLAIDCRYDQAALTFGDIFKFECCVMLVYESKTFGNKAVTIMDGDFGSIYPAPRKRAGLYLVSTVKDTCISAHTTPLKALRDLATIKSSTVCEIRKRMENVISCFYKGFSNEFNYRGWIGKVKVKPVSDRVGSREYHVKKDGRIITAFAEKISHIMLIEDEVKKLIQQLR